MATKRYTQEQLIEAIKSSTTQKQVIAKLNLRPTHNTEFIRKAIKDYEIDASHMYATTKGVGYQYLSKRKSVHDYLNRGKPVKAGVLKYRLIRDGYLPKECYECRGDRWMGKAIPLEIHHIDGDRLNNSLDNLMLLCPNCHAQTDTYCGKNIKNRLAIRTKSIEDNSITLEIGASSGSRTQPRR